MAEYLTEGSTIAATTNGSEVDTATFVGGLGKRYYLYNPSDSEYLYATYGNLFPDDPSPSNYIVVEPGVFSDLGKIPRKGMEDDIHIKLVSDGSNLLWEAAQGLAPTGNDSGGGGGGGGGTGQKGDKGDKGDPGKDGQDGAPGADGADGADGAPGKDLDASAYLPLTGGTLTGPLTVTGGIDAGGTRIQDVANPLGIFDAVNKQYADAAIERIMTYQTSPTNMSINRNVDASYYDEPNHRILMWRNYFGRTGMTPHPHLIVGDPETGDVTYLESTNPTNHNRREPISSPFHVGDDIFFVTAENPKDHTFLRLTPDNSFEAFGTLKICRSWCVLNYHVPLTDRFHLFVGNPSDRIDPNGGNGSRQAQATLLLDTEDLLNQTQVESYEANGETYGTLTKSLSTSRGGVPGVIFNGTDVPDVYLFQPDKQIQKVDIKDLESKDVGLVTAGPKLTFGYLMDPEGKRVAEIGKINGLTVLENRYIVWHSLNEGIMWYDTADESLECIYPTDNFIEYGFNRHKIHPNVPNIGDSLYFFPHDTFAHDWNVVAPELLIVGNDKTVEVVPIPDPDFKSTNTQRSSALEIVSFDQSENMTAYNVNDRRFERYVSSEALQTGITIIDPQTKESVQKIIPWVAGAGSNPSSFKNCRLLELKESLDEKYIADLNLLANPIIEDHENDINNLNAQIAKTGESYIQSMTNEDAIYSLRDGLDDMLNPRMVSATEDPDFLVTKLFEHAYPLFPDESDRFYNLIPQRFVMLARMYEGSGAADDLLNDEFGNDDLDSAMILDVKTGKTRHLDEAMVPGYNDRPAYPALRGSHVITNEQGEVDVYFWCHAPMRTVTKAASPWESDTVPLFHIHIPAEDQIDDSNPFDNLTFGYSKIRCHKGEMTYPDKNPYGNYVSTDNQYQYEIDSNTFKLKDAVTGKTHYFFCSFNKNAKDYVTHRIFEFTPNPNGDMEYGQLHPVDAHPDSTWGGYASGYSCIKEDVEGVEKCFLFGTPVGVTELYFVDDPDNVGKRKAELRNYGDYIPLGPKVVHPTRTNVIGQPIITGKGIIDNWYKNQASAPQWVNKHPINNDDRMSCTFVFYLGGAGIISVNTQDLGIVDRSDEVKLENNYHGDVNSLHIGTHPSYMSYIEGGSVKNLPRFNAQHIDMHSLGSAWFFDYKGDYIDDPNALANGTDVYNDTKVFDADGNLEYMYYFKRGIIEVRVDPVEEDIMVIAHSVGRKRSDTNVEENPTDFSGEGVTKVYDMFVCSSAGKSHSSITKPRVYTFNPLNQNMSLVDNRESAITSLVPLRKEGLIVGSSYGTDVDGTIGTPLYMIEMLASRGTTTTRKQAAVLRKLYSVTGDSVADDPDTWELDEPGGEETEMRAPRDPEPDFDIDLGEGR